MGLADCIYMLKHLELPMTDNTVAAIAERQQSCIKVLLQITSALLTNEVRCTQAIQRCSVKDASIAHAMHTTHCRILSHTRSTIPGLVDHDCGRQPSPAPPALPLVTASDGALLLLNCSTHKVFLP